MEKLISDAPVIVNRGTSKVLYENAEETKKNILDNSYNRYRNGTFRSLQNDFEEFRAKESYWLNDYAVSWY